MSYLRIAGLLAVIAFAAVAATAVASSGAGSTALSPASPTQPATPLLAAGGHDLHEHGLPRHEGPGGPFVGRSSSCFRGSDVLPGVSSMVTFEGGTFADLDECANDRDVVQVRALAPDGRLLRYYLPDDPIFTSDGDSSLTDLGVTAWEHWNASFVALYPAGLPPYTPLVVHGGLSGSPTPDRGPWWETWPLTSPFHESPDRCFIIQDSDITWQLAVYRGGSIDDFSGCLDRRFGPGGFGAVVSGRRNWYTMPDDAEHLADLFRDGIAPGTPFYVESGRRGTPPDETCLLGAIGTGWSLVTYNEDGADLYMLDSCAASRGVSWIRRLADGRWIDYRVGRVNTANSFRGWDITSLAPFLVFSYEPSVPAPEHVFPWWSDTWVNVAGQTRGTRWTLGCFRPVPVDSVGSTYLAVYRGGSVAHLESCIAAYDGAVATGLVALTIHRSSWIWRHQFSDAFVSGDVPPGTVILLYLFPE